MSIHVGEKHGICDQKNMSELKSLTMQMVSDGSTLATIDDKNWNDAVSH